MYCICNKYEMYLDCMCSAYEAHPIVVCDTYGNCHKYNIHTSMYVTTMYTCSHMVCI